MKSKLYPCLCLAALAASALLSTCSADPRDGDTAAPLRFDGDAAPLLYGRPSLSDAPQADGLRLWLEPA